MSNLNFNNVYWEDDNLCPAVMNDGRGGLTNFKNNRQLTKELYSNYKSSSPNIFRKKLQSKGVNESLDKEWLNNKCKNDPGGMINFDNEIVLNNGDSSSFKEQFKSLTDDEYSDNKYNKYKLK